MGLEKKTGREVMEIFALFEQMTPGDHFRGDNCSWTVCVYFFKDHTTSSSQLLYSFGKSQIHGIQLLELTLSKGLNLSSLQTD